MARSFAKQFYNSTVWHNCRDTYVKRQGGLCESCLSRGIITPGEIVHHIIPLTPDNISDPNIALGFDNLRLLCRECHADVHMDIEGRSRPRITYRYDADGRLTGVLRDSDAL